MSYIRSGVSSGPSKGFRLFGSGLCASPLTLGAMISQIGRIREIEVKSRDGVEMRLRGAFKGFVSEMDSRDWALSCARTYKALNGTEC